MFRPFIFPIGVLFFSILSPGSFAQTIYEPLRLDEVEFSKEDLGHMWTFDAIPVDRFKRNLEFEPDQEWIKDVQMSAIQFGGGCSGSFVSGSGLIMTNHHCARGYILRTLENGADILKNGYYAQGLENELKIEGLYVDQLIEIQDVTQEISSAMEAGKTEEEKGKIRDSLMADLSSKKAEATGLESKVVKLYQGGKYSLYSWMRYNDIRLVMAPTFQLASTGWDWDNYTYPRYELDMAFLRAYDSVGNPIESKNFFKWSAEGAAEDEPVFVVGRPGSTARLVSNAEVSYLRETALPILLDYYNGLFEARFDFFLMHPERESELFSTVLSVSNGRKRYAGRYLAVKDPLLLEKKKKFETDLQKRVSEDPVLQQEYGDTWENIEKTLNELAPITKEYYSVALVSNYSPSMFKTAKNLAEYAREMEKEEKDREKPYKKENLEVTRSEIFVEPEERDLDSLWATFIKGYWSKIKMEDQPSYKQIFAESGAEDPYTFLKRISVLDDRKAVEKLIKGGSKKINALDDPILKAAMEMNEIRSRLNPERRAIQNRLSLQNQRLGELIFKIYGNSISPDGTGTLRISEGRVKGYEYNGTLAPSKTTFYGLYDRYYGFGQKNYPWGLDEVWKEPTPGFDLSTPINFSSTTDIVGGNSGSAIINKNAEVVGLAFDGNLEGISGYYMYLPAKNRTVGVDSKGMLESFRTVYKYPKLVMELEKGSL